MIHGSTDWISIAITHCHLKVYSLQVAASYIAIYSVVKLSNISGEALSILRGPSRNYAVYIIIHGVYRWTWTAIGYKSFFSLMNVGGSARIRGLVVNEDESCRPVTDVQVPKKLRLPQPSSNSISFRAFLGFRQRMPTRPYYVYPSICLFGRLSVCLCFCHRDVLSAWKVCIIFWQTLALIAWIRLYIFVAGKIINIFLQLTVYLKPK